MSLNVNVQQDIYTFYANTMPFYTGSLTSTWFGISGHPENGLPQILTDECVFKIINKITSKKTFAVILKIPTSQSHFLVLLFIKQETKR